MTPIPAGLPALHDAERPHAWAVAYLDGSLSEAERASFEAHLAEHAPCRAQLATLRAAFPVYGRVLMEDGPPRPIEDYVAYLKAAEARIAARQAADPKRDRGAEKTADAIGRLARVRPVQPARQPLRVVWVWGGGAALLTAAAAALLVIVQPFAGVVPQILVVAEQAPGADDQGKPPPVLPPAPTKVEVDASIRFGRLELLVPRAPGDFFTSVAIVDSKHQRWLVQSGEAADERCVGGCGPLELKVKLDPLAPGPFRVAVLLSEHAIGKDDFGRWLPKPNEVPQWLGARAYGVAAVGR